MKELQLIKTALDRAAQKGVFNLDENAAIVNAINSLAGQLQAAQPEAKDAPKEEPKPKK